MIRYIIIAVHQVTLSMEGVVVVAVMVGGGDGEGDDNNTKTHRLQRRRMVTSIHAYVDRRSVGLRLKYTHLFVEARVRTGVYLRESEYTQGR